MPQFTKAPEKDPSAVLDYLFDWAPETNHRGITDWLEPDERIAEILVTIDPDTNVNIDSSEVIDDGKSVLVWLSGGTNLVDYNLSCKITTDNNPSREDTRTFLIPVRNR